MLPLYQTAEPHKTKESNVGLWFERFFDGYDRQTLKIPDGKKFDWLQKFENAGDTEALQLGAKQQLSLVNALKGKYKFFNTQWHFVTGTGYPHPVENGLLWHKTYGVPYLSGAAVKGLVRAWVEEWQEFDSEEARKHCLFSWFGSDDKEPKEQQKTSHAGDIIFFDAFPVQAVTLKTDIMTPHYGKWYSEGGNITDLNQTEKIPADWHDPVPIPFLVVDSKTPFLFSVALRPRSELIKNKTEDEIKAESEKVMVCLTEALEWLGAGAKTATGYGGFIKHDNHPLEKEWKKANQSLEDEIKDMTEKQLMEAFSKDYTATKKRFPDNWQQVIEFVWKYHEKTINSWSTSQEKNPKKAFKKLTEDKQP